MSIDSWLVQQTMCRVGHETQVGLLKLQWSTQRALAHSRTFPQQHISQALVVDVACRVAGCKRQQRLVHIRTVMQPAARDREM